MRLESLDLYETSEGRAELLELAERLREAGADVEVAERDESVHSVLQEDAFHEAVTVLNVVLTEAEHVSFLVSVIKDWGAVRRHFGRRQDVKPSVDIWSGEDDDVLDRILLPEPGSKWCLGCDEWVLPEMRRIPLEASGGDGPEAQRAEMREFCPNDDGAASGHLLVKHQPSDEEGPERPKPCNGS